ncbi:TIR domain-containing protein [Aliarcobacter butzleri]|uniref:TIR domain-containing protein n=1 Tax=Aliarcobacter butzleri TaxID=28197 RepID=UPI00263DFBA8|nr:TIR domain-containing protein [Aliarcobacter butzleri]MDN5105040.1 TIR domain-containing protein [Aliarcobacter butzleri]
MAIPNIFISHRWAYSVDYTSLTSKLKSYCLKYYDYSVPEIDPFDLKKQKEIKEALKEQIRQCNYFIVFANMAMNNSEWVEYEIEVATYYNKPILSIKPHGYSGNVPKFIQTADTEEGPVGFNTPSIIKKICTKLEYPIPKELQNG